MDKIIKLFKEYDSLICAKGAQEKEIKEAETALDLKFSEEYKAYLKEFGAVIIEGAEFNGIINSKRLNVVDVTINERKRNSNIPKDLYVIENVGVDGVIILQNAKGEVFSSVPSKVPEKIAKSFEDYLKNR